MKHVPTSEVFKVRCDRETHEQLLEAAALQRRPVANLLRLIVADWLQEHATDRAAAA